MAAVEMIGVHKRYRVYKERYRSLKEVLIHRRFGEWEERWALRGLELEVQPGRTMGLIGSNGAGKSTALKLMARILVPDLGRVRTSGRLSGLLELGAGFQPEYTGRENVYLNASLLGLSRAEINRRFDSIVAFAELEEHIDAPVRTYSSGMYMRLGFSVAIHVEPEILLVDEILAVGDEAFQAKCFDWLERFQDKGGTVVVVSHNLGSLRDLCSEVCWLDAGVMRERGDPAEVIDAYVDQVRDDMAAHETRAEDPGSGRRVAVELGQARLLDAGGRPVSQLEPGDSLTVEIPYLVHRRLEQPLFGVAIHRNDGVLVFATNTDLDRLAMGSLGPGPGRLTLTYPRLDLCGGTFRVTVMVFDGARRTPIAIDSHWQRYSFHIPRGTIDRGLVELEHRWAAEGSEPAGRRRNSA
jgi:ABC-type polysaccharide/polyol phosphate transport system ATPase subunit